MQVKKDEVRQAILCEAEKEFFRNGFQNASIRKIAKAAGTTIGNIYNYFGNKEELFDELVAGEYRDFLYFVENHDTAGQTAGFTDFSAFLNISGASGTAVQGASSTSGWRALLEQLVEKAMPMLSQRFVLLIECSKGTKYENARHLIVGVLKEHFSGHLSQLGQGYSDGALAGVVAEQLLNGVVRILRSSSDEAERKKLLSEYFLFHIIGFMGLRGIWQ